MTPTPEDLARDLDVDLDLVEKATAPPWTMNMKNRGVVIQAPPHAVLEVVNDYINLRINDGEFIAQARTGWPSAIRLAKHYKDRLEKIEKGKQDTISNRFSPKPFGATDFEWLGERLWMMEMARDDFRDRAKAAEAELAEARKRIEELETDLDGYQEGAL